MYLLRVTDSIIKEITKKLKQNKEVHPKLIDYISCAKPTVKFTEEAEKKMWALVTNCSSEIGWHGLVERNGTTFTIYDILVYPQEVTSATITADEKLFSDWIQGYIEKPTDEFEHMRMHGHSHVNMACSPSGVDTNLQMDTLATLTEDDYYIFMIVNKKKDMWIQIYDNKTGIVYEKDDISINDNEVYKAWATEQMEQYLTKPQPKKINYWNNSSTKTKEKTKEPPSLKEDIDAIMSYYDDHLTWKK